MNDDLKLKARQMIERYLRGSKFVLNPDQKQVDRIVTGLAMNEKKFGWRFCPCRIVEGDMKKDAPKICPCKWHKDEIKKDGHCKCILFTSKDWAEKRWEELKHGKD